MDGPEEADVADDHVVVEASGTPSGPRQVGRGVKGQYVYWITMSHPSDEVVQRLGLKVPSEFSREEFSELIVKAHGEVNVQIVETVCFFETHSSGLRHHNCLVRAKTQFKWARVAGRLRSQYNVCVNYGANIKTWAEGVVYGRVASEHKGAELLDHDYTQWEVNGNPEPLEEFIPRSMKAEGFVRKCKMTPLAFLDVCRNNGVDTEEQLWALAVDLEEKGDKGLMAYLLEVDVSAALAKVRKVVGAKQAAERAKLSRIEILQQTLEQGRCSCQPSGLSFH